jgi:cytochrome c biogenesis protein CcmG/thiol:disulfide interchange protein DsbE
MKMIPMRYAVPLLLFATLVAFLGVGLNRDPRLVPSPLIGKPAPEFSLGTLATPDTPMKRADLLGRPFLLNVWASWCTQCREEHPLLLEISRAGQIPLIGLNYHDELDAGRQWLTERGDPYRLTLFDPQGKLGLDLGVYGVPETFLIDASGVIRYKHIGPLTSEVLTQELQPLLASLEHDKQ